jgi:hypothetical protein
MKLIPAAPKLPPLYANENKPASEVTVPVKLFNPCGAATWYLTEYDPETETAFGLCDLGMGFPELGYVSIKELKGLRLPMGLGIERDLHWDPKTTLAQVMEKHGLTTH